MIEDLIQKSHKEIAEEFPSLNHTQRSQLFANLLPGDTKMIRGYLSSEDVAQHIKDYAPKQKQGPFGELLPDECTADPVVGFGGYDPAFDMCAGCNVAIECFCNSTGRYYEEMVQGDSAERDRIEEVKQRAAELVAGRRAKNAYHFDYQNEMFNQEPDRYSVDRLFSEDGSFNVEEFSYQINQGKKGLLRFFLGISGDHLMAFPYHKLVINPQPLRPVGVHWRLKEIEGENNKKTIHHFFDHCKENGDTDRQIVTFLFWFLYGVGLPIGWRYCLDRGIKENPRYIWSEYIDPANNPDAASMVLRSGPVKL